MVSAEIAKIHTLEWTPTILGLNPMVSTGMDTNWHGLSPDIPIPSGFATGLLEVSRITLDDMDLSAMNRLNESFKPRNPGPSRP